MAALLLADLKNPKAVANPQVALRNPQEMFAHNAIHGGAWRMPYKFNTVGEVAVLIHFIKVKKKEKERKKEEKEPHVVFYLQVGKVPLLVLFVLLFLYVALLR